MHVLMIMKQMGNDHGLHVELVRMYIVVIHPNRIMQEKYALRIANDRGGFASVHIDLLCLELAPGINHLVAKPQSWM